MHNFEKLKIWQKAMDVVVEVYKVSLLLPVDEKFNLIHQIKKCAVSIPSNIAEGSGRNSNKDKARFSEIAYGSSLELLNQVILCHDFEYIDENEYIEIREKITEVNMLIDGLYKSQISNAK
uniref:four helix bundle protein n=1 Tax=Flavobacterium sp. TaxID=239 RepID=UPI00404A1AAC